MVVDVKYVSQRGGWCSNGIIGSYGWVSGNSLERVGMSFLDILDLIWEMVYD
jgi:hypothetical protein